MLRSILEPEVAALAAVRADQVAIGGIGATCDAMEAALEPAQGGGEGDLNARFHIVVAEASGPASLAEFVGRLWKQILIQGLTISGPAQAPASIAPSSTRSPRVTLNGHASGWPGTSAMPPSST
jgi:DNA-binding FadR family transcriptional regulator